MSFFYPGFLFALAALSVPILIHLFNFRKFKKVYFSNVRFLKDIEVQTSSSKNLKKLLVLIARCLAVTFLVLAFAKPFVPASKTQPVGGRQVVSVYIDNSFSMESVNKEGTLLDEARRRARQIAAAYSLNDKFQLLTNDFEGRHQRLLSYDDFLTAVEDVKLSAVTRTIPQVISRQQDIFSTEPASAKAAYLISDFQKNMVPAEAFLPDSTVSLRFVKLEANSLPNVSVDSIWFVSPIHKPGETEKLVVQLRNNSDKVAENIPVKLSINDVQKAVASLTVPPRDVKSDTLTFSGLPTGWQQGEIRITDYPVVFDDKFFFTFNVRQRMPVMVINNKTLSPFLEAVYRSDPFFTIVNSNEGNLNYTGLSAYPMIILNELPDVSQGLAEQLKKYVDNGGSLMVFPSLAADLGPLTVLLKTLGTDVPEGISEDEAKVVAINTRHELFNDVFEKVPKNIDLPVARQYVRYSSQSKTTRQDILSFAGGKSFFSRYRVGQGMVYLSAVPLEEEASNFARHSVFVPIMFQAALMSSRDSRLFYTLGRDPYVEIGKIAVAPNQVLKLKKNSFEVIPDVQQNSGSTRIYIADQLKEEGNYSLMKSDSLITKVGFNDNRTESDLTYLDEAALKNLFPGRVTLFTASKASIQNDIKEANQGVHLWKVCLILALFFLAAEVLLIRFYRTAAPQPYIS